MLPTKEKLLKKNLKAEHMFSSPVLRNTLKQMKTTDFMKIAIILLFLTKTKLHFMTQLRVCRQHLQVDKPQSEAKFVHQKTLQYF